MEYCVEGIEETPSEDGIVRVIHFHHIEGCVLSTSVVKAAERYRLRYGTYWFNFSSTKTIQGLRCFFQLLSIETHLQEGGEE
jgi:hypothetical protein